MFQCDQTLPQQIPYVKPSRVEKSHPMTLMSFAANVILSLDLSLSTLSNVKHETKGQRPDLAA